MTVELLTEHHLEFLSFKGGCTGSSESTLVEIPHCWKSHATAYFIIMNLVTKKSVFMVCNQVSLKQNTVNMKINSRDLLSYNIFRRYK